MPRRSAKRGGITFELKETYKDGIALAVAHVETVGAGAHIHRSRFIKAFSGTQFGK